MATRKAAKKSSSGSDPKSKRTVKRKMATVMDEFKHGKLESGRSGKKVRNRKQAIAIGLSEARRSGADIPPDPNKPAKKKSSAPSKKKTATKKNTASKKKTSTSKKTSAKKKTAR